jgi:hypothetical protein
MELRDISIDEEASEDIVQFIKHLEENTDPSNEFDCQVWFETVHHDTVETLPGEDIYNHIRGGSPEIEGYGVHVRFEFEENSECPSTTRVNELARNFFGDNFSGYASFEGSSGEANQYVFLTEE